MDLLLSPTVTDVASKPGLEPIGWLATLVFVAGACSMASEILVSRFLGPFFGSSLLIWTLVIFSVLVALTIGYLVGGRSADRSGRSEPLYQILQLAAFLLAVGPFVLRLVLLETLQSSNPMVPGMGLVVTILYFCFPIILIATTGPYVIRLLSMQDERVGYQAGRVLGVSTLGSILGTFVPTYILIPYLGTIRSFLMLSTVLGILSTLIHFKVRNRQNMPFIILLVPIIGLWFVDRLDLRPLTDAVAEVESIYNNIKVREQRYRDANQNSYWRRLLVLNEGFAVHSISIERTASHYPIVGSVWDYMALMPVIAPPEGNTLDVGIVGLAGGTVAKGVVHYFKDRYKVAVQGAEIDPKILEIARDLFDMTEPEIEGFARDGRSFLRSRSEGQYDMILTDAYRQPYIPFHLTTREYFELVESRLKPAGFAMINCGAKGPDDELLIRMQETMVRVFTHVYRMEVPRLSPLFANYLVLASNQPIDVTNLIQRPAVTDVLARTGLPLNAIFLEIQHRLVPFESQGLEALTDDKAPVEYLVDLLIVKTIFDPNFEIPEAAR